jgi:hypothetical protein
MDSSKDSRRQEQRIENSPNSGNIAQGEYVSQVQVQNLVQVFVQGQKLNINQFKKISGLNKIKNYIVAIFFLFGVLIVWVLLGFFASSAFPTDYILAIIQKTFEPIFTDSEDQPYDYLAKSIVDKRNKISDDVDNLKDFCKEEGSLNKAEKLNQEDSRQWLIQNIVEILSKGNSKDDQVNIVENLQEIESQREIIREYLVPLIEEYYPNLARAKKIVATIKPRVNQDQKIINSIVNHLFSNYVKDKKPAKSEQIKILLQSLNDEIINQKRGLSPKYTKILIQIFGILEWVASAEISHNSVPQVKIQIKALKTSEKYHFEICDDYPFDKDVDEYDNYELAEKSHREPCAKCSEIYHIKNLINQQI